MTDTIKYVSEEEYAATVKAMDERIARAERVRALKAQWREFGCRMTLAKKLEALRDAKEGK